MKIWKYRGTHRPPSALLGHWECRLEHPSRYQNRPCARRNHITASRAMFHAPMYVHTVWAKFRLPSTESLKNKTRVVGEGKGMVLAWGGGGAYGVFLPTRDPHSPSCGHFHTHFQKIQFSRNAGMRDKRDEGWAKQWGHLEFCIPQLSRPHSPFTNGAFACQWHLHCSACRVALFTAGDGTVVTLWRVHRIANDVCSEIGQYSLG
jgi:hypothetical protein